MQEEDVDMVIPETDVQDIHMQEDQHFQEGQDDCRMMEVCIRNYTFKKYILLLVAYTILNNLLLDILIMLLRD